MFTYGFSNDMFLVFKTRVSVGLWLHKIRNKSAGPSFFPRLLAGPSARAVSC
jgi:hypothetical protein